MKSASSSVAKALVRTYLRKHGRGGVCFYPFPMVGAGGAPYAILHTWLVGLSD